MSSAAPAINTVPQAPQTHRFGSVFPKLVYLAFSCAVTWFGGSFLWEPLGAMLHGKTVEARVAEIRVVEPGQPDRVFRYRRDYPPESNLAITFQHYVTILMDDHPVLHRISVDSRKTPVPAYGVNDKIKVAYRPDDPRRIAYVIGDARTWGAGGLFTAIGLAMLSTAIPMLLATRRPVTIDPEAPAPAKT